MEFQTINHNRIVIEFIANGFIVCLPKREEMTDDYKEYLIKKDAKFQAIFESEIESDSEIARLQGRNNNVEPKQKYRKLSVKEMSDKDVYVFKTFPEVIEFLNSEFVNQ